MGRRRCTDSVLEAFETIGSARIEAVATDMGPAYISAVRANIPDATLVFDHFHIIKLFNEKLTKLRCDL